MKIEALEAEVAELRRLRKPGHLTSFIKHVGHLYCELTCKQLNI